MILPNHLLKLMSPSDRAKLGPGNATATEAQAKYAQRTERAMHDEVEQYLRLQGIPYIHSRMDKKPTIREGWPDFTCLYSHLDVPILGTPIKHSSCCCIELKVPGATLRPEQRECIAELDRAGVPVIVATSAKSAIDFIIQELLT